MWLTVAESHLLPRHAHVINPRAAAACLGLKLQQLHPHLRGHKHLRWLLRRVLGLPWVVLVVLLLLLLLLLEVLRVLMLLQGQVLLLLLLLLMLLLL